MTDERSIATKSTMPKTTQRRGKTCRTKTYASRAVFLRGAHEMKFKSNKCIFLQKVDVIEGHTE